MKHLGVILGLGVLVVLAANKAASAATPTPSQVPNGWEPPANSTQVQVPSTTLGFPVRGASWQANGQEIVLWWDPTDPQTFLAMQLGTGATGNKIPAVLAMGSTAHSLALANLMKQVAF